MMLTRPPRAETPQHTSRARTASPVRRVAVAAAAFVIAGTGFYSLLEAHEFRSVPVSFAGGAAPAGDSATVVATLSRFHTALSAGDSAGALALLAPDASILESGDLQTRAEYTGHHLMGDIEFARAVHSQRTPVQVVVHGDVAWVASGSTTQGEFRGRPVNSVGAELAVLSRGPAGWQIRSIHWSARARRAP